MKLTFKQRIARLILAWFGEPIDDPRLDLTSAEHPAFTRGFFAAYLAASRQLALIDANRGMSDKQKCVAFARYASELRQAHEPKKMEAEQ